MRDFELEPQQGGCRFNWDLFSVYNGRSADEDRLIGTYCGSTVPYYFRSIGRSMFVSFKSDNSAPYPGFEAAYYFIPGRFTM